MTTILLIFFFISAILVIPIILMQSGEGAEAGMFGSDLTMGAFGAKSNETLVKITRWFVVIFMLSAFLYGYIVTKETQVNTGKQNIEQSQNNTQQAPAPAQDNSPEPENPVQ